MGKRLGLLTVLALAGCRYDSNSIPDANVTFSDANVTFSSSLTPEEVVRLKTLRGGEKYVLRRELPSEGHVVPPYHEIEYSPKDGLVLRDVVPFVTFGTGVLYIDKDADGRVDWKSNRSWHSMLPSKKAEADFQDLIGLECDSEKAKYEWGTPEFRQCAKLGDFQKAQIFYETAARWFLKNQQQL